MFPPPSTLVVDMKLAKSPTTLIFSLGRTICENGVHVLVKIRLGEDGTAVYINNLGLSLTNEFVKNVSTEDRKIIPSLVKFSIVAGEVPIVTTDPSTYDFIIPSSSNK
jgi:hypothetical protein